MEAKCWCQVEEAGGCCGSAAWAAVRAQAPGASTAVEVRLAHLFLKVLAHCACARTPVGGDQWQIVSVFRVYTLYLKRKALFTCISIYLCVCARVHALARAISARIWCVCVYAYLLACALSACRRLQRPEEGGRSPRTGVTGGCKSLGVGAENSIVPCQSNVLLITEPPL